MDEENCPNTFYFDCTRRLFGAWRFSKGMRQDPFYQGRRLDAWVWSYEDNAPLGYMAGVSLGADGYPEYDPSIIDDILEFTALRVQESRNLPAPFYSPPHWTQDFIVMELRELMEISEQCKFFDVRDRRREYQEAYDNGTTVRNLSEVPRYSPVEIRMRHASAPTPPLPDHWAVHL